MPVRPFPCDITIDPKFGDQVVIPFGPIKKAGNYSVELARNTVHLAGSPLFQDFVVVPGKNRSPSTSL